jgi:4-aminobutyrate aminotransferase / (S)-3-amino-2-methylpropionate transaminase
MVTMQFDRRKATDSKSSIQQQITTLITTCRYNTWVGDSARVLLFNAIYDEIKRLDLVDHTREIGAYVYSQLEALQSKYPGEILNLRGKGLGTFIAWDSPRRDEFVKRMRAKGVHLGGCGERAVRLRPMLVFQKQHADILLRTMEEVLKENSSKL